MTMALSVAVVMQRPANTERGEERSHQVQPGLRYITNTQGTQHPGLTYHTESDPNIH